MNRIEPTGSERLEWYLARILGALQGDADWRLNLIGYEPPDQSEEEALRILEGMASGDPSKS